VRPVILLSGEGSEGATVGSFVEAITGLRAPTESDPAADILSHWVDVSSSSGLMPLIMVDEFDSIATRFDHRFFERLRGMLDRACLIVATRQKVSRIYHRTGRTSPFYNRLKTEWLGLLEPSAASDLFRLAPSYSETIREWAGRHPYYIQLVGHHLIASERAGESFQTASDRFQAEAAARLSELWTVLSEREKHRLQECLLDRPILDPSLRLRGLTTEEGKPFGRILTEWLPGRT
jgi:hypothetical protein